MPALGSGGKLHKRDTVNLVGEGNGHKTGKLEGCGFTIIRFVADNPGAWPFHCHIEWHQVMGMAVNFYYDGETIPDPINRENLRVCGAMTVDTILNRHGEPQETGLSVSQDLADPTNWGL